MNTAVRSFDDVERALQELYMVGWTTYVPDWLGASSNPSIGNGVLRGGYQIIGGLCSVSITIEFGSSTNSGSGEWSFSLPVPMVGDPDIRQEFFGGAAAYDDSATKYYLMVAETWSGYGYMIAFADTVTSTVRDGVPITWATDDRAWFSLSYPVEARVS